MALVASKCLLAAQSGPLLRTDFEQDPTQAGWALENRRGKAPEGEWWAGAAASGGRALLVRQGWWQSPAMAIEPLHYYRMTFASKTTKKAYCAALFYDKDGKLLPSDVYDSVFPSGEWEKQAICFRSRVDATHVRLRFQALAAGLYVDDVTVREVGRGEAAVWADVMAARCPVVRYVPPPDRWKLLPKTMATLRDGGRLRIVMLGDSICNDTSNSLFETLLMREYPEATIETITSVANAGGCHYYQRPGQVQRLVLRHEPDLLIIAGISHGYDEKPIRNVIQQVRAASDCEVMVMNGTFTPRERVEQFYLFPDWLRNRKNRDQVASQRLRNLESWPTRLRCMCAEERVELLDMRTAWDEYIVRAYQPQEWFMRDPVHANRRGKAVLGRVLLRYFQPR